MMAARKREPIGLPSWIIKLFDRRNKNIRGGSGPQFHPCLLRERGLHRGWPVAGIYGTAHSWFDRVVRTIPATIEPGMRGIAFCRSR